MKVYLVNSSLALDNINLSDYLQSLIEGDADFVVFEARGWEGYELEGFLLEMLSRSSLTCKKLVVDSQIEVARKLGLTYVHLSGNRAFEAPKSHTNYSYTIEESDLVTILGDEQFAKRANFVIINTASIDLIIRASEEMKCPVLVNYSFFEGNTLEELKAKGIINVAFPINNTNNLP